MAFLGACVEGEEVCVVSELMELGPLDRQFGKRILTWEMKMRIARDVARAMTDLHCRDPPILHRDLKSQNILLDEKFTAKVSDFGLSKVLRDANTTATMVGTLNWMAPELIRGETYGVSSDVYSFGIVMWQVLTERSSPFEGDGDSLQMRSQVLKGIRPIIPSIEDAKSLLPPPPSPQQQQFSSNVKMEDQFSQIVELMQRCWDQDPEKRPSFLECLEVMESICQNNNG